MITPGTAPTASEALIRWTALGSHPSLVLESAEVTLCALELRSPVGTAAGIHRHRPLVLVQLHCRSEAGSLITGWGECAALADTTYDTECADGAFDDLTDHLLPGLFDDRSPFLSGPSQLATVMAKVGVSPSGRPLAWAALEQAVADAHLRASGQPWGQFLGVNGTLVAPGAVVGQYRSTTDLVADVEALADQGYCRIKLKVGPGWDVEPLEALQRWSHQRRNASGDRVVTPVFQVDANAAYRVTDIDHLAGLDRFPLVCIEQPFPAGDLHAAAELAKRITTPICFDEGVASLADLQEAVARGGASLACIKPARLGGFGRALEIIAWCERVGVPWWVGGMFESGYGRAANTALAALGRHSLAGDLSPAATYLSEDLVDAAVTTRGQGILQVAVGEWPGFGPVPDRARRERLSRRHGERTRE